MNLPENLVYDIPATLPKTCDRKLRPQARD
jgi:hypothetical protein